MKDNYIRHMPYLKNSIAYDNDFWCTCVKWWYPQVFFFFFIFPKFWFFWLVGLKGQEMAQDDKKFSPPHFISQEPHHTSYDCHLWYACIKWWCFPLFQNFDFLRGKRAKNGKGVRGVKGQKIVQNDNKLCLSLSIS